VRPATSGATSLMCASQDLTAADWDAEVMHRRDQEPHRHL
jgi:hypothetical protein